MPLSTIKLYVHPFDLALYVGQKAVDAIAKYRDNLLRIRLDYRPLKRPNEVDLIILTESHVPLDDRLSSSQVNIDSSTIKINLRYFTDSEFYKQYKRHQCIRDLYDRTISVYSDI